MKKLISYAMILMGAATLTAAACKTSDSGGDGCSSDDDCKGDRVCVDGECKTAGGNGGSGGSGGTCSAPAEACSVNGDCCQSGDAVGPYGAVCIASDAACHAKCYSGSECNSGCCAAVEGESYGVCASADHCETSCSNPGDYCSDSVPCCQSGDAVGPYGAICISNDDSCHAKCYSNSGCASGCCAGVEGQDYGVCAAAAYCG